MLNLILAAGIVLTFLTGIPVALQMRNHPKGLLACFFIEMWERFSFYGMRGLLIFYLTKQFLFSDDHAAQQYSSYMTLIYLIPLIGGIVADRWIGTRKAAIFGGVLLVLGHFGMYFEGKPAQQVLIYHGQAYEVVADGAASKLKIGDALYSYHAKGSDGLAIDGLPAGAPVPATLGKGDFSIDKRVVTSWAENAFYLSISLIIMGVGFLKPNVSSLVGALYRDRDPRRDAGFQLYYFGINLGSFWAAIVCGWLGQTYGWKWGFGAAGVGMLVGLLGFLLAKGWLESRGGAPQEAKLETRVGGVLRKEHLIYLLSLAGVGIVYFLVQRNDIVFYVLVGLSLLMLGYVVYNMVRHFTRVENFRILLALLLSVASIVFFALEELAGSALNLFADRNINLQVLAAPVRIGNLLFGSAGQVGTPPPGVLWIDTGLTAAQSSTLFSAAFILILAPIFAALFTWLGNRRADPDPVKKFAFGIVATGVGLMVLVWGAPFAVAFRLPLVFLVMNYFLTVVGEMSLSPVGLSQQTKLSPTRVVSTMMALWFTGLSWAQFVGGKITSMTGAFTINGEVVDPAAALQRSLAVFSQVGLMTIGFGIALFVLSFFIKGWAGGVNDSAPVDEDMTDAR